MNLDTIAIAIVVVAAVAGAFAGALPQLVRLAAIAAGWIAARAFGPSVAPMLQGKVPAFAAHPIASVAVFVAASIAVAVAARIVIALSPLRSSRGGGTDRGLGALLAGAQAALVLWVALSAFAVWGRPVRLGSFELDPAGSDLVGFAREYNALGRRPGITAERR